MKNLLLGVGALAALTVPNSAEAQRGRSGSPVTRLDTTVAVGAGSSLTVTVNAGDVIVTGWSRNEVRLNATSDRGDIRFEVRGSRVTAEIDPRRGGRDDSRMEMMVPIGAQVRVRASGDVTVKETRGDVDINSLNGDITVAGTGRLGVNTLSGDVRVERVAGDADLKSLSGDVRAVGVQGEIAAQTVSGDIEMSEARASFVRANTTSGDVSYSGTIDKSGRYELVSHSGDVSIVIPSGTGAELDLSTFSGEIDSDFPITLEPGEYGIGIASGKHFRFAIGGGGARIALETFSGDLTISSTQSQPRE